MPDYDLFFSTLCLTNALFVGLYVAVLLNEGLSLKQFRAYGSLAMFWFFTGCIMPLILLLVSNRSGDRISAIVLIVLTTISFSVSVFTSLFRTKNRVRDRREPEPASEKANLTWPGY